MQNNNTYIFLITLLVLFSSLEQFLRKSLSHFLFNYKWFLIQIFVTMSAVGLSLYYLFFYWLKCGDKEMLTHSIRSVNKGKFLFMSFIDLFATITLIVATGLLPSVFAFLCGNYVIVYSAILCYCCAGLFVNDENDNNDNNNVMEFGLLTPLIGVFLVAGSSILFFLQVPENNNINYISQLILMLISGFFAGFSVLYKRKVLSSSPMDYGFTNIIISLFTVLMSFITFPIVIAMQYIGTSGQTSYSASDLLGNISGAANCFIGYNSVQTDNCEGKYLLVQLLFYAISIAAINILSLKLLHFSVENYNPNNKDIDNDSESEDIILFPNPTEPKKNKVFSFSCAGILNHFTSFFSILDTVQLCFLGGTLLISSICLCVPPIQDWFDDVVRFDFLTFVVMLFFVLGLALLSRTNPDIFYGKNTQTLSDDSFWIPNPPLNQPVELEPFFQIPEDSEFSLQKSLLPQNFNEQNFSLYE